MVLHSYLQQYREYYVRKVHLFNFFNFLENVNCKLSDECGNKII